MSAKSVLVFSGAILLGIVCYKIILVPTSLKMNSHPQEVYASSNSPVIVKATVVNKLGFAVPFERLEGKFIVYQGSDIISVVRTSGDEIVFRTKGSAGRLVIYYYSSAIPFPVEIILNIKESAIASLI